MPRDTMFSMHSHSGEFCRHASDTLEQIIQQAIKCGFIAIGLSEHVYRTNKSHMYPDEVQPIIYSHADV